MFELTRAIRDADATDFGKRFSASLSSNMICRWRFDSSTKSRSTTTNSPTPARASVSACTAPSAPQPMITTFD
jgi:hypothetical protein